MRIYDILRTVDPSFPNATAFIADEIARKIDGEESDDFTSWPPEAYGNIAPPYPRFFVEARTTTSMREIAEYRASIPPELANTPGYAEAHRQALAARLDMDGYDDTKMIVDRALLFEDVTSTPRVKDLSYTTGTGFDQPPNTCWVLAVYGFMRVDNGDLSLFPGHGFIHIGADGRLLDDTGALHLVEYPREALIPEADYSPIVFLSTFVPFGLFAIKALHDRCAVELETPSRQVRRAMERKEGITPQRYYILKINTPVPQKRYPKPAELIGKEEQRPGVRRHDVRGHFHFYTPEKPLFGRIAGAVWIPAHKRGKETAGTVKKDYLISPAKGDEEPKI